jgi:hypothetical protein
VVSRTIYNGLRRKVAVRKFTALLAPLFSIFCKSGNIFRDRTGDFSRDMGRMKSTLFILTVLSATSMACVHNPTFREDRQHAYFVCPKVQVTEVEKRLAQDGWPLESSTASQLTTAYRPLIPGGSLLVATTDRAWLIKTYASGGVYSVRIAVSQQPGDGVRFHLFQSFEEKPHSRELEWDRVYEEQIADEATRNELNFYRSAVCGGGAFFTVSAPKVMTKASLRRPADAATRR